MRNLSLALIALGGMISAQANAVPITWTLDGVLGNPSGSFMYDADFNSYSAVNITNFFLTGGNQTFTSGTGTNVLLAMANSPFYLDLNFSSPLTNTGGEVGFWSDPSRDVRFVGRIHGIPGLGTVEAPSSVPEPGSLLLLGTGLVALGLVRRRRPIR